MIYNKFWELFDASVNTAESPYIPFPTYVFPIYGGDKFNCGGCFITRLLQGLPTYIDVEKEAGRSTRPSMYDSNFVPDNFDNIYSSEDYLAFGFSNECLSVITREITDDKNNKEGNSKFLDNVLPDSYSAHYTFMYLLMQHQKFAITDILKEASVKLIKNSGMDVDEDSLYKLSERAHTLQSVFYYNNVSNFRKIQSIWSDLIKVFHIEESYEDINEILETIQIYINDKSRVREKEENNLLSIIAKVGIPVAIFQILIDMLCFQFDWIGSLIKKYPYFTLVIFISYIILFVGLSVCSYKLIVKIVNKFKK